MDGILEIKNSKMKRRKLILLRYSVFITLLYILVGCTGNRVQMQRLQVIDSLMEPHPQAAYDSLCRFDSLEMGMHLVRW